MRVSFPITTRMITQSSMPIRMHTRLPNPIRAPGHIGFQRAAHSAVALSIRRSIAPTGSSTHSAHIAVAAIMPHPIVLMASLAGNAVGAKAPSTRHLSVRTDFLRLSAGIVEVGITVHRHVHIHSLPVSALIVEAVTMRVKIAHNRFNLKTKSGRQSRNRIEAAGLRPPPSDTTRGVRIKCHALCLCQGLAQRGCRSLRRFAIHHSQRSAIDRCDGMHIAGA